MEEQIERRRVFAQDQSLPNRATTFHQFAQADAQTPRGRFSAIDAATVVGANPTIDYPAGPTWSADPGAQCVEPPLGFDNPAFEPSTALLSSSDEATGPTSDDPSPLGRGVGSLSSQPNSAPADAISSSDDCDDERRGAGLGLNDDPAGTKPGHFPPRRDERDPGRHPFRRRV